MKKTISTFLIILSLLATAESSIAIADSKSTKYISLGTGAITGVYYPSGGAICRLVNRGRQFHNIRCAVESTGGSVANINAIQNNSIDFAIVQSDWAFNAYKGHSLFRNGDAIKDLRILFSLHTETFVIAVLDKSGINSLDDIKGKKVNFGPQGSGMYATMELLLGIKGWNDQDFSSITYLQPSEQTKALCDGKIDAMIYVAGNPNGVLQEATQSSCSGGKVRILSIDSETVNKLIKNNTFYVKAKIPGGIYSGNPNTIDTFGIKALVITSAKNDPDLVYNVTKSVFENFDNFKTLHPVFSSLKKEEMTTDGIIIPLHEGAIKYFKENKLPIPKSSQR